MERWKTKSYFVGRLLRCWDQCDCDRGSREIIYSDYSDAVDVVDVDVDAKGTVGGAGRHQSATT